mmetsp:Transcript_10624/g.45260  ORF Transcript_10624/g.45260 Transcript_10624/m.45260 type:complete len:276 (-) Transcript_10624:43-870(-)
MSLPVSVTSTSSRRLVVSSRRFAHSPARSPHRSARRLRSPPLLHQSRFRGRRRLALPFLLLLRRLPLPRFLRRLLLRLLARVSTQHGVSDGEVLDAPRDTLLLQVVVGLERPALPGAGVTPFHSADRGALAARIVGQGQNELRPFRATRAHDVVQLLGVRELTVEREEHGVVLLERRVAKHTERVRVLRGGVHDEAGDRDGRPVLLLLDEPADHQAQVILVADPLTGGVSAARLGDVRVRALRVAGHRTGCASAARLGLVRVRALRVAGHLSGGG